LSSSGHFFSPNRFADPNFANDYDFVDAYSQAKTANILHALSLAKKLRERRISAFSLRPGSNTAELQKHINPRR
jgi:NAD(P)-dependent dehydrogenase (short-subunit alcohol dehydrogenase family)